MSLSVVCVKPFSKAWTNSILVSCVSIYFEMAVSFAWTAWCVRHLHVFPMLCRLTPGSRPSFSSLMMYTDVSPRTGPSFLCVLEIGWIIWHVWQSWARHHAHGLFLSQPCFRYQQDLAGVLDTQRLSELSGWSWVSRGWVMKRGLGRWTTWGNT